jgi:hypothetical protein
LSCPLVLQYNSAFIIVTKNRLRTAFKGVRISVLLELGRKKKSVRIWGWKCAISALQG